jgi:hypothetical protein
MIATVIALVYALSPIDLLPDLIPLAGFLDDAAILAILLEFFVAGDLLRYRAWRDPLRQKGLEALNDKLTAQILEIIADQCLAAAFLTEQKKVRMLLCTPGETSHPLPCRDTLLELPLEQLESLGVEDWDSLGEFLSRVFEDDRIHWSHLGQRPFCPEYDPQAQTDDFITEGKKALYGNHGQ